MAADDSLQAFREFEHAGWEKLPARYHDAWGSLTSQTIGALLNAAGVGAGARVLDVASGPGYVAAAAAQRGASVIGVDFAAAMVQAARRGNPALEFRQGDAEALDFPDASFDAVVMNFGLLHLARPERAFAEAHRVLRAGGRAAFTVWATPAEALGFGIVLGAIERHGDLKVPLPPGPPFFRFSEAVELRRALAAAGFAAPEVKRLPLLWRLAAPEALFEVMHGSTVRTGGLLRAQQPAALEAIRAAMTQGAAAHRKGGAVELPMAAVLGSALRR